MKPQILFVPGCHDNYDLLAKYPEVDFCGGKARQICGHLYELLRGQIYTIDGKKIFSIRRRNQPRTLRCGKKDVSWWPQEAPEEAEYEARSQGLRSMITQWIIS